MIRYKHLKDTIVKQRSLVSPTQITPSPERFYLFFWIVYRDKDGFKSVLYQLSPHPEIQFGNIKSLWDYAEMFFKADKIKISTDEEITPIAYAPVSIIPEAYRDFLEFVK